MVFTLCITMSPPGRGRSFAASLTSSAALRPPSLARSSSGGGEHQIAELDDRADPCRTRRAFRDHQRPQRLGSTVAGLGDPFATTRQRTTRGFDRVDPIGLAALATLLAVRTIHLDHRHRGSGEVTGEAGPIGAGALDANTFNGPEPSHPRCQRPVSIGGRWERFDTEQTAVHVDDRSDVGVAVCVDPTHDQTRGIYDGHRPPLSLVEGQARTSREGDQ